AEAWDNLAQEFEALASNIGRLHRQAGGIAARLRQAGDVAAPDRVAPQGENDRDDGCRVHDFARCSSRRDYDIDLEPDEFCRDFGEALGAPLRPTIFDCDGAALDPTEFAQSLRQSGEPWAVG